MKITEQYFVGQNWVPLFGAYGLTISCTEKICLSLVFPEGDDKNHAHNLLSDLVRVLENLEEMEHIKLSELMS